MTDAKLTEAPAALLNRAADHLEMRTRTQPQGPRTLKYCTRKGTDQLIQIDLWGPPPAGSNVKSYKTFPASRRADAEYQFVTQPDTILGFVRMLRLAAGMAEGLPEAMNIDIVRAACDVARTILGETA